MRDTLKRKLCVAAPCDPGRPADEDGEYALLAEFMRHDTVASLAGAIAERLDGESLGKDLIADAELCSSHGRG
jgi:hypothetical protein